MDSTSESFIRSPLFTFTVDSSDGPKDIRVHSQVVAEISPALKSMMELPMSEGISHRATISDVDFDTFERLCEFAYKRQYNDPIATRRSQTNQSIREQQVTPTEVSRGHQLGIEPQVDPVGLDFEQEPDIPGFDLWPTLSKKDKKHKKGSKGDDATYRVEKMSFEKWRFEVEVLPSWTVPCLISEQFDCSHVFIGHAKLYAVAKIYMCENLCNLVLYKLHKILGRFTISTSLAVWDIVQLIRYIYSEEHLEEIDGKIDQLRHLVSLWVVTRSKEIGLASEFVSLLGEGGVFVQDYWTFLCTELLDATRWQSEETT